MKNKDNEIRFLAVHVLIKMNNKIFIYLVFQLLVAALLAKDSLQFSFSPSNDIVRAVIVLAPGMNTDGAFFFFFFLKEHRGWILPGAIILE